MSKDLERRSQKQGSMKNVMEQMWSALSALTFSPPHEFLQLLSVLRAACSPSCRGETLGATLRALGLWGCKGSCGLAARTRAAQLHQAGAEAAASSPRLNLQPFKVWSSNSTMPQMQLSR